MADQLVIDDSNYMQWTNPIVEGQRKLTGYYGMWLPPVTPAVEEQSLREGAKPFEEMGVPEIPESEWDEIINQQERDGTTLEHLLRDFKYPSLDQDGTNFCWAFATVGCAGLIRLQETARVIVYSGSSVAAPKKRFANQGGFGEQAIQQMLQFGMCEVTDYPQATTAAQHWNEANRTKAAENKIAEWFKISTWQQYGSCLLAGIPCSCGHNWWRHQVMHIGLTKGAHDSRFRNSWGKGFGDDGFATLSGSKKKWSDCVAVTSLTPL